MIDFRLLGDEANDACPRCASSVRQCDEEVTDDEDKEMLKS